MAIAFQFGNRVEDGGLHAVSPTSPIDDDEQEVNALLAYTYLATGNEVINSVSTHYSTIFGSGSIAFALYEHDGSIPQAFVAASTLQAVIAIDTNRKTQSTTAYTADLNWPLEAGKRYTLGIMIDSPGQNWWGVAAEGSGSFAQNTGTTFDNWLDPAGSTSTHSVSYSLWANGSIMGTGTTVPGEPADGTPFDPGLPEGPQGSDPYTTADDDNFDPTSLESTQEIGASEQLLICDWSGFKIEVCEGLRQTWDNFMVRQASWEPRQPLDFVRSKPEYAQKGSPRPEQDDIFLTTNQVSSDDL